MLNLRITAALAALLVVPGVAPAVQQDVTPPAMAAEEFETLSSEVSEVMKAWYAKCREQAAAAREAGEEVEIDWLQPLPPYIAKFQAGAEKYAGTEAAVPFLCWLAQEGVNADRKAAADAFETLCMEHTASAGLREIASDLPDMRRVLGAERTDPMLARLEESNPDMEVRGWAMYARLEKDLNDSEYDSEAFRNARDELAAVAQELGSGSLAKRIRSEIDTRETFSIGMVAPDIEGIDLDGTAFKLSDYDGKVVFLDFWGDW